MTHTNTKYRRRTSRHARIRSRIAGTATKPRLSVYRSNRQIYAQLIDDMAGHTLAATDSRAHPTGTLTEQATHVGTAIAAAAKQAGIESVVFDRGGFQYHGVVKAVAEAARAGGLTF